MASLSDVFKAYDIRGVVPDQLNADQFRAIGVAVARFTGAPPAAGGPGHARVGGGAVRGLRRRRPVRGGDRGRPGPGLHRPALLRRRQPRRPRGHVHRLPQSGPVQRAQAVPVRGPTDRAWTPAWPRSRPPPRRCSTSGRTPARPRPTPTTLAPLEERSVLDAYADHVRSFVDVVGAAPAAGWWPTPPTAWAAWWRPKVFEGLPFDVEILFPRARRQLPQPPGRPHPAGEPGGAQAGGARRRRRRRPGLRRRRRPGVPGRRDRPSRCRAH